ncbi:hypothetical protein HHI36_022871, partial [Cryptolaemus montrouzieri]
DIFSEVSVKIVALRSFLVFVFRGLALGMCRMASEENGSFHVPGEGEFGIDCSVIIFAGNISHSSVDGVDGPSVILLGA